MSSLNQVRQIVATLAEVPVDQVLAKSNLIDDLGMDSLDAIEAIIAVEEKFGVNLRSDTFKGGDETPEEIARRVDALINPPFAELADLAKAGTE